MSAAPVGIIANPASGKDIRRLVAHASVFDNEEKRNIVRRAVLGASAVGATRFVGMPDQNGLVETALDGLKMAAVLELVESPRTASALDTERAAAAMREAGCAAVIVLGGDGTNRAVARGWQSAPLVSISTGTNNVFPRMIEGTIAGTTAGLVATGALELQEVAAQVKLVHVSIEDERDDLALIDAVLLDDQFVGSRAIWDTARLRFIVLSRADPAAVGMSGIGGLLRPLDDACDGGAFVEIGQGGFTLQAPIAPGLFSAVSIRSHRTLKLNEAVVLEGPGIIALDGERERLLRAGQRAEIRVLRDGPFVIDVARAMQVAAHRGHFRIPAEGDRDAS